MNNQLLVSDWLLHVNEVVSAARILLERLRQSGQFANDRVAVVGDLAMHRYFPNDCQPAELDLLFTFDKSLESLYGLLARTFPTDFELRPNNFNQPQLFWTTQAHVGIRVRIWSHCMFPFVPLEALPVQATHPMDLPFILPKTLLVFEIWFYGIEPCTTERRRQKEHVREIMAGLTGTATRVRVANGNVSLTFTPGEMQSVRVTLPDMLGKEDIRQALWDEGLRPFLGMRLAMFL